MPGYAGRPSKSSGLLATKLLSTKREEVPSEPAHQSARQQVERADEQAVVGRALPPAVKTRLHGEPLGNDTNLTKPAQQLPEFGDAEFHQDWGVLVLEAHLHELRQRIQPR